MDVLHVECEACVARGPACHDCVISVLLGAPGQGLDLDPDEQAALSALADSGLGPVSSAPGPVHGARVIGRDAL